MLIGRKLFSGVALSALMLSAATAAEAQTGVVIMRKVIDPAKHPSTPVVTPVPTPTPTPTSSPVPVGYYSWTTSGWKQTGTCGSQGLETRSIACVTTDGDTVADSFCTGNNSGPKPEASRPVTITATCGYTWSPGNWSAAPTTCGTYVQRRDISCLRSDGTVVETAECRGAGFIPDATRTVTDTSSCSYAWSASAWSAPSSSCGDGIQTRTVICQRSDGAQADAASCTGEKPATSQTVHSSVACTAEWKTGQFGSPAPACGNTIATRSVTCERADGVQVASDQCGGTRPSTTQPAKDYSTCTDGRTADHPYGWTIGDVGAPSTTCGTATLTRSVTCTDDAGAAVSDAMCVQAKPSAPTTTTSQTSGCGYSWQTGEFGAAQPSCGTTVQSRTVSCVRSDGQPAASLSCVAPRPAATQSTTDYSACTYGWASESWSPVSTTCGDAVQTRKVYCQRADGAVEADQTRCTGEKPADTQSSHQTIGCTADWSVGAFGAPAAACGATTQTRTVVCRRGDGVTVDDAQCSATKPDATQPATSYSACTFAWTTGVYSEPSTTCGTATQTRTVTCQRSDGTVAGSEGSCTTTKPSTTQTTSQVSGCSYAWTASGYGSPVPACGATVRSRSYSCVRSDGTAVAGTFCSGPAPTDTSEATTDYSTCSYSWDVGLWQGSAACGISVQQNRSVRCRRSDGTTVSDAQCGAAGTKPASSQTISDYSACSYAWNVTYGTWSSTCSANATRTNVVVCRRGDGTTVGDEYCTATKPATTDTQEVTSSCSYTPTYSDTYSTCTSKTYGSTAGTQSAPIVSCKRSDGADAALSSCSPQTKTQDCVVPNTSDRYVREASYLNDPFTTYPTGQQSKYVALNVSTNSELKLTVNTTLCWDSQSNATAAASNCSALDAGPKVYDIISIPATFVSEFRTVYLNQADIMAAAPHITSFLGTSNICVTTMTAVVRAPGGSAQSWTVSCGTPDDPSKYSREPSGLRDPYISYGTVGSRYQNVSTSASTLKLSVYGTMCWNNATNSSASSSKCTYLSNGPSTYDIVSVPSTVVEDLREVYVNQADIQAIMPHGSDFMGRASIASGCTSGDTIAFGQSGVPMVAYTIKCGTPDSANHYERGPYDISDPFNAYASTATRFPNQNPSATSLVLATSSTYCWDTTANAYADNAKCTYLPTGTKRYDQSSIPATFVPDLHEIYVSSSDLTALYSRGRGSVLDKTSVGSACNGSIVRVGTAGGSDAWTVYCGTPDSPDHYARFATTYKDPYTFYQGVTTRYVNDPAKPLLYVSTSGIQCWDTATSKSAPTTKCSYLPLSSGPVAYTQLSVPAVWNTAGKTVTVKRADLAAISPYASSTAYTSVSTICGNASYGVNPTAGTATYYTVVCQ